MVNIANICGMVFTIIIFFIGFLALASLSYEEFKLMYELTRCKEHIETKGIIKKFKYLDPVKKQNRYPIIEINYLNQVLLLSDFTCIDNLKYDKEGLEVIVFCNPNKLSDRCYIKRKDIFSIKWFLLLLVSLVFLAISIYLLYCLFIGNILEMGHSW